MMVRNRSHQDKSRRKQATEYMYVHTCFRISMIWNVITPNGRKHMAKTKKGYHHDKTEIKATEYNARNALQSQTRQYTTPHDKNFCMITTLLIQYNYALRLYIISNQYSCLRWSCRFLEHPQTFENWIYFYKETTNNLV